MEATYTVGTLRAAGLEARWTKTRNGAPIIVCRDPEAPHEHQRKTWWAIDAAMWKDAETVGIRESFRRTTLIADIFSIPA